MAVFLLYPFGSNHHLFGCSGVLRCYLIDLCVCWQAGEMDLKSVRIIVVHVKVVRRTVPLIDLMIKSVCGRTARCSQHHRCSGTVAF